MAIPREGYFELHDATLRLVTIDIGGACRFSLEGVARFRHVVGSRFTREVFNATLALSGCDAIEMIGSWAASDNYVMDMTMISGGTERTVWPGLTEEIPLQQLAFSLFSGARIAVRCVCGELRLEGEAIESGEWISEPFEA